MPIVLQYILDGMRDYPLRIVARVTDSQSIRSI
jgi:hypothetical protein